MNEHFDLTYKSLFRRYYTNLLFYATRIVGEEDAEDGYRMFSWSCGSGKIP